MKRLYDGPKNRPHRKMGAVLGVITVRIIE